MTDTLTDDATYCFEHDIFNCWLHGDRTVPSILNDAPDRWTPTVPSPAPEPRPRHHCQAMDEFHFPEGALDDQACRELRAWAYDFNQAWFGPAGKLKKEAAAQQRRAAQKQAEIAAFHIDWPTALEAMAAEIEADLGVHVKTSKPEAEAVAQHFREGL